jgi:protein-tyrosine phosphatase
MIRIDMAIKNYREYNISLAEVGEFNITAMHRPFENRKRVFHELMHAKGRTSLISLVNNKNFEDTTTPRHLIPAIKKTKLPFTYMTHEFEEHGTASIESLERFCKKVISLVQNSGPNIVIHCYAGNGRSGTMIAALKLYSVIQKASKSAKRGKII